MSTEWSPDEITVNGREYVAKDKVPKPSERARVEELFTVTQVSKMSGVSRSVIYSLMDRGILAYVVPNGCERPRLVPRSTYEDWVGLSSLTT